MHGEIDTYTTLKDIEDFRAIVANEKTKVNKISLNTYFTYAVYLIKSRDVKNIQEGIGIIQDHLCKPGKDCRDALFYLSLGFYRLKEYQNALQVIDRFLEFEPNNSQANELKSRIVNNLNTFGKSALIGGALLGAAGIAAVAGLIIGSLLPTRKNN